jgi:hypothetical protein
VVREAFIRQPWFSQGREPQGEDERTKASILSKIVIVTSAPQEIVEEPWGGRNGSLSRATLSSRGNKYGESDNDSGEIVYQSVAVDMARYLYLYDRMD